MRLLSRIKEMTREVVREGEDRRGVHTAQGIPLKIYMWWRQNTKRPPEKVGLCNYFWIVVLWAPLLFIWIMLGKLFSDRQFWICMSLAGAAIVIGAGIAFPGAIGVVLAGIVVFGAAIGGLFIGFALAFYLQDKSEFDDVPKWVKITSIALIVPTLPMVVAGFIVGGIVITLTSKLAKRFYRWTKDARLIKGYVSPFNLFLLFVAGFVVALSVIGGWWIVPLIVVALVAAIFAGRWAAEKLGYYLARRREDRRVSDERAARQSSLTALEPVLRIIFNHLHPAQQENEGVYWRWYRQYVERAEQQKSATVWSDIYRNTSPYYFPDWDDWNDKLFTAVEETLRALHRQKWQAEQRAEQQRQAVVQRVTSPFTATGDFIILLAQYIYAAKKRICPYIELPKDPQ